MQIRVNNISAGCYVTTSSLK